jgi:uncharacterized membrane protein
MNIRIFFADSKLISAFSSRTSLFSILLTVMTVILFFVPTGYDTKMSKDAIQCKAEVIEVDNALVKQHRIIKTGAQVLTLKILNKNFSGEIVKGYNNLIGKLELDTFFSRGDRAFVVLETKDNQIRFVNIIDHYRLDTELFLFLLFIFLVVLVAGWTGAKSILTFIFTTLFLWKVLLPLFMRGINPIPVSLGCILFLTAVIVFSIAGIEKKGVVTFLGAASGVLLTCLLSIIFGKLFNIHGAVRPFSESLLYTGFPHMNITEVFLSGIFIASSGAVMDVAMDISAAMYEIAQNNPSISRSAAIKSGLEVGKAVIGTMTTTLLLAYSGGFTAMFMLFIAQGTPILNILNIQYVAAEILHTLVGSFGLITVAPLTAFFGGIVYIRHTR